MQQVCQQYVSTVPTTALQTTCAFCRQDCMLIVQKPTLSLYHLFFALKQHSLSCSLQSVTLAAAYIRVTALDPVLKCKMMLQ